MTGAELLVKCLEREGVEYVFGIPGEETLDLNDALRDSKIQFVTVRHEQGGAFMADVYGRLTGRAGVCMATLGPGATNLATGLADANLDRAPVVAITGQVSRDRMHKESHQFVDIVNVFGPLTKWSSQAATTATIPEVVRKAFKLAQEEKPGTCLIELPEDVAEEPAEGEPLRVEKARRPSPDRPSLQRAAELINQARRPLILAGNGAIRGRATDALRELAEHASIPVVNTFMAKGVLPADHALALTTVGLAEGDYTRGGFEEADCIIAVGYDPVEYGARNWNPSRRICIVHIDFTSAEVDAYYQPAVEVVADVREVLELLTPLVTATRRPAPVRGGRGDRHRADAFPMFPERVLADLEEALAPDDLVISDVGAHKLWLARFYRAQLPNTVIISNGFAAMGIGVPGAVAAKMVFPKRRVVAVCGDGGFLMNVHELETAKRLDRAIVVLIFRDDGYGSIRWKQEQRFGRTAGVDFGNPDFTRLAEAFGCRGYRIESAARLLPTLREALAQPHPAIIDCPIDYRQNNLLLEA